MIDFNPKRNVSKKSSIGLHVHSKSCALAKLEIPLLSVEFMQI